jgi:predicted dehydrogenase
MTKYFTMKPLNTEQGMNRRQFLRRTAAGTAALGAGAWSAKGASASERISIGIIGTGSRGSALMKEILNLAPEHHVQITAVCDVWKKNLATAAAEVKKNAGTAPRQFTRFGDLLNFNPLDAVVIATPDFSHGPILVAALQSGKDVFIEKPMTIDVASANQALDLVRAQKRVVQTGTQRRSEGRFINAAQMLSSGVLGRINRISAAMNFHEARWVRSTADCYEPDVDWESFLMDLPPRTFDPKLLRSWQLYRDFTNGLPGLWMTHYADAVHMLTGAEYPAGATALGGNYIWKDGREHPDTFHALLDYPEGFIFHWGMRLGNSAGVHFTIHGTEGTLDLEKWTLSPEGGKNSKLEKTAVPSEGGQSHMANWLECLRSRQRPVADILTGHQHAIATIMAATAWETGQRQIYDPVKRAVCAG